MRRQTDSLAFQLSVLVAGVALVVFAGVGVYLYQSLAAQLEERDDAELIERLTLMRHLVEESASVAVIRADPHRFIDSTGFHGEMLLDLRTERGDSVIGGGLDKVPEQHLALVPVERAAASSDMHTIRGAHAQSLRSIAAWGKAGDDSLVKIRLARNISAREALLSAYRLKVYAAIVVGAVLTALMGYAFIWRGLGKVRSLARQAEKVTANQLQLRLDATTAPAELRELASAFNEVLDRLERSFDKLSQFSADLAHDMRTPLNNLMVQTQVMLSQPRSSEEYEHLLNSNHEEFERLSRMVESMLFLARADHNEIALSLETVDLAGELDRLAEYFEGPAADAGLTIVIRADGKVFADPSLFRRAVGNLVSNALRYTPAGQVIALEAEHSARGTTVRVANPGPGIAAQHLPHLFDRFYRSDASRASTSLSAGLGLAIVQSIMTLHHGQVSVTSEPGKQTIFSLFFPSAAAHPFHHDR